MSPHSFWLERHPTLGPAALAECASEPGRLGLREVR